MGPLRGKGRGKGGLFFGGGAEWHGDGRPYGKGKAGKGKGVEPRYTFDESVSSSSMVPFDKHPPSHGVAGGN